MTHRQHVAIGLACVALFGRDLSAQLVCQTPWTLEETLRVGSVSGADALTFPIAMELDRSGRIYIAQSLQPFVTVFSPQGRPERTIGRAGQGPGEFRLSASNLGWLGDTLWVADSEGLLFFTASGQFISQIRFRTLMTSEWSAFEPGTPLADGSVLVRRAQIGSRPALGSLPQFASERRMLPVRRFRQNGEVLDTIAFTDWSGLYVQIPRDDGSTSFQVHPMAWFLNVGPRDSHPMGIPTRDGRGLLFVGQVRTSGGSGTFELVRVGLTGDTLLRRSIPFQPKPVTTSEAEGLRDMFAGWVAGDYFKRDASQPLNTPAANRSRREARAAITFPPFHPPVRQVIAGHDGSVWLLREFHLDGRNRWIDRWEIYDGTGQLRGSVEIAEGKSETMIPWRPRLHVLRATLDEVWGVTTDDLDVAYLHRYRITKSCG